MSAKYEQQKKDIMQCFDFHKVSQYMLENNHQWYDTSVGLGYYPTALDIRKVCEQLLDGVIAHEADYAFSSTGRMRAEKYGHNLRLVYELCEWSSEVELLPNGHYSHCEWAKAHGENVPCTC